MPAGLHNGRERGFEERVSAGQIDGDDPLEGGDLHFVNSADAFDSGVNDKKVDAAIPLDHARHRVMGGDGVADVANKRFAAGRKFVSQAIQRSFVYVKGHDTGPASLQFEQKRMPDARRGAAEKNHSASERETFFSQPLGQFQPGCGRR